jgi:hypothetical protein
MSFAETIDAFVRRHGPLESARRLGVSARTCERWAAGTRQPRAEELARVLALIEPSTLQEKNAPLVSEVAAPDDALSVVTTTVSTLRAELERLRTDQSASARERASVATSLTTATRLLARLSGSLELTEKMIIRAPATARVIKAIIEALRPFPGATEACAQALQKLDEES